MKGNSREIQSYVNSKRKIKNNIDCVNCSGENLHDSKRIADNFVSDRMQIVDNDCNTHPSRLIITMSDIAYALEKIQNKKSVGMDKIPASIVKLCPDAFLRSLY